jgi:xanthine dehydrogenase accessory factor
VLVEPVGGAMPVPLLENLVAARAARRPVACVADLESGARRLDGPGTWPERFRMDRSGVEPDGRSFVHVHNPPLRLLVVGAVHIAQALVPMARIAGYDVQVIDPRPAFGAAARFPDTQIAEDWPDEALDRLGLDARTAVVTLTHDPKLDDPAITAALRSDIFYLGCLGSTRTHAKRVARLEEAGFSGDEIARIHAPVGLDIGARGPAEIAVSVLAEITQRLRKG